MPKLEKNLSWGFEIIDIFRRNAVLNICRYLKRYLKLKSADQKQKTADNWYFGSIATIQYVSIAQVTFAGFEITLSDDRPLSVSLANVVVAYRIHGTLFLKNSVSSNIWNFSIRFKL